MIDDNTLYELGMKAAPLIRIKGREFRIVHHGNLNIGRMVYQPKIKEEKWISAIPLIEVILI